MLSSTRMLGCKLVDAPMDPNWKFMIDQELLHNPGGGED